MGLEQLAVVASVSDSEPFSTKTSVLSILPRGRELEMMRGELLCISSQGQLKF